MFVRRSQLGEGGELVLLQDARSQIDLGLDVRLVAVRPDEGGIALRAEQEADRLREDRLAGSGLAGDRIEPRSKRELRFVDQDEILDA